jgi:hypothetical protein
MNRLIAILLCCMLYCTCASAQMSVSKDSLNNLIRNNLQEMLSDKSYTRIPSSEFDNIMVEKISSAIDDKFKNLYWYVGFIGFILGSLLFYSGNRYLKDSVQNKFAEESASIQGKILSDIEKEVISIKNEMESKLKDITQKLEKSTDQLTDAKKEILLIRLEKIRNEIDSKVVAEETFQSLKKSLKESESLIDNALIEKVIALLSTASYYLQKETEMEKVVQTYMNNENIKMNANVFINLASGYFYTYHSTQDSNDKVKCLFYINESLKRLPYYGEAYGLKLELLMLDFSRTTDAAEKPKFLEQAKTVLDQGKYSGASINEVIGRFSRVSASKVEADCIQLLKDNLPTEWQEFEDLAKQAQPTT